jgi:hypothetical protein
MQQLLKEQNLKVVNQSVSDIARSAMLEHVLPEGQIRQESDQMVLEVLAKETLRLLVGLHFAVVRERQYDWEILRRM